MFNALYRLQGMTVTNNIRDNVTFDNIYGWQENNLTNEEIENLLQKEKDYPFLSFSYRSMGNSVMQEIIC